VSSNVTLRRLANHFCTCLSFKMGTQLVRSIVDTRPQQSQRTISNRSVTAAILFSAIALLLAVPFGNAYASSSNSAIYSFGAKQPLDGAVPKGSLTYVNGLLFGRTTTVTPGSGDGVIFHFNPSNVVATYSIDHVFTGNPDGENPRHDAMTPFNGQLFGTTLQGGTNNTGIIFSIAQNGSNYTAVANLAKATGDEPHSCFVVANNTLYGMTSAGGDHDGGVLFSFDPSTSSYQPLYSFRQSTGNEPHGRLTLDPNGTTLYGMTRKGGSSGFGVVFSVDTSGNNYQVLHDFAGGNSDGATSDHGYVVQSGNWLYGMTTNGGPSNNGVIFALTTDGKTFTLLHTFGATSHDGKNPYGSLLLVGNQLYGTTANGGDYGMGTVFVINTDGSGYARLHSFGSTKHDGAKPIDNVILVNGALFGMTTEGGTYDQGSIFKVSLN
jgi:uncharacterized repeat protein (TIGR03803 family)